MTGEHRAGKDGTAARATAKDVAEYLGARALGAVLRAMSPDAASALMGFVMGTLMRRTSKHERALQHLALALPELAEAEREGIARRMWQHLGRVSGEAFLIDRLIAEPWRVEWPDDFTAATAIAAHGAIAASLHLGNWELAGVVPTKAGLSLAVVYQTLHNPLTETYLKRLRAPLYPAGLYTKGPALGPTLIRLARRGAGVGIASDLREKRGIGVMFFGMPAYATPIPAMLARLSGRPLIAGALVRTSGAHFRALVENVPVAITGDRDADVAAATQALHDVFERWIRAYPDQWMWSHRKWARSARHDLVIPAAGAAAAAARLAAEQA